MAFANDIFDSTMALIDELSATGQAQTADTEEYKHRTPSILDIMVAEMKILTGDTKQWASIESIEDYVPIDDNFARSAMKYGLAANLLIDENPSAASFYEQRYEELRNLYLMHRAAEGSEDIVDLYGGIGFRNGSRW